MPAERLDKEFSALAEMEGVTDVDELNRVLDHTVGLRTFQTADERRKAIRERVESWAKRLNVRPRLVRVRRMTRSGAPARRRVF